MGEGGRNGLLVACCFVCWQVQMNSRFLTRLEKAAGFGMTRGFVVGKFK
jgi:hypothetical protein